MKIFGGLFKVLPVPTSMDLSRPREANSSSAIREFSNIFGTRRLITVFTRACRWSLPCARCLKSKSSYFISLKTILMLSSNTNLGLPIYLLNSGFHTKSLYVFSFSPMCTTCLTHLTFLIIAIILICRSIAGQQPR